jgi:hypothetical protein
MMICAVCIFSICFVFPFTLGVDGIFTSLIVTPFVGRVAFQRLHRPFHTLILLNFIFIEVINRPRKYVMKIVVLRLAVMFDPNLWSEIFHGSPKFLQKNSDALSHLPSQDIKLVQTTEQMSNT